MAIDRAINLAANDIADSIDGGRSNRRRAAMREFLKMALWAAASAAEGMPSSAWVNIKTDDAWLKTAAEDEKFDLPATLTDKQFRDICELLKLGEDSIAKTIPFRLKMDEDGSIHAGLSRILGPDFKAPGEAPAPLPEAPKAPAPKSTPEEKEDKKVALSPDEPPAKQPAPELSGKVPLSDGGLPPMKVIQK